MTGATPFFLNESIPEIESRISVDLLEKCVRFYIKEIFDKPVEGVFHTSGDSFCLFNALDEIEDFYLKGLAYRLFSTATTYPVEEEDLISYEGYTLVNNQKIDDAFGHTAAFLTGGFLFTLPVYDELKSNYLKLFNKDAHNEEVRNFFGDNHLSVTEELEYRRIRSLTHMEYLKEKLPAKWTDSFKHAFEKMTKAHQEAVVGEFIEIKKGGFQARDKGHGMKHVSSERDLPLYELKVFNPAPIRVFFTLKDSKVYIISLFSGKSGSGKAQSNAIANAKKRLKSWP